MTSDETTLPVTMGHCAAVAAIRRYRLLFRISMAPTERKKIVAMAPPAMK